MRELASCKPRQQFYSSRQFGYSLRAFCSRKPVGHPLVHQQSTPPRFRSGVLACYTEVARFLQLDAYSILRQANIDPRWVDDPTGWLPAKSVAKVLDVSATLSGRDDFGIIVADCQSVRALGPFSLLVQHEPTVRGIITSSIEFRRTISDTIIINFEETGDAALLAFDFVTERTSPQLANLVVAIACNVLSEATVGRWRPRAVHFRHGAPSHQRTFSEFFGCPISFQDEFDGWSCEVADLEITTVGANDELAAYARHLLYLTPEMSGTAAFRSDVYGAMYLLMKHGAVTLERTAAHLGMSPRSLQRRLDQEGQSFTNLLNDLRRNVAQRTLAHSSKPISEIAYSLGFSSQGSFARWFARYFGCSPSVWRSQRLKERGSESA